MRARVAYISSFGTTTILVGSALLMLAVGSAIVAFRGWPAVSDHSGVASVPLAPAGGARHVATLTRLAPGHAALTRAARGGHAHAAARRAGTAGLVKAAPAGAVPGLVMVPAHTTISLASPPGARFPAPTRPPVETPGPRGHQNVGPDGGPALPPVPVSGPSPAPPADPGQITTVAGSLVGAAPPPPSAPATPGAPATPAPEVPATPAPGPGVPTAPALDLDAAAAAAAVLDRLH
jgi:hypothetical protein